MTSLLFLSAPGGDDLGDHGRIRRFHTRVTNESPSADAVIPSPTSYAATEINGIRVSVLLARLRDGDQSALTTLYDALFEPLWRVAALQMPSSAAAEDVVHDVFLWLWTHRGTINVAVDIRVYLTTATRNRARNDAKHRQVVERANRAEPLDSAGVAQAPSAADASLESADFLAAYRRALTLLSERELTAALLRWEEGFTFEQIAQVLSVSTKSAQRIVLRARDMMYEALRDFR